MMYDDRNSRHEYGGGQYYNGHHANAKYDGSYESPRITHSHIQYGRNPQDMDIAKTFDHEPFRHTDPKYKCLCNKMHVKQGCKFILGFLIAVVIIGALLLILNWNVGTWTTFVIHCLLLLGVLACAFALFIAMKAEKEKLLLPVAGIAAFGALVSIVFFVFTLWSLIDPSGTTGKLVNNFVVSQNNTASADFGLAENRGDIQAVSAVTMVLSLLGLAASIWVAFVVYKYSMYLKDMKFARVPKNQVHIEITDLKKGITQ
ncbi:unnamed protein product [Caenorhabditis bovis]|uniref:Uncharacterized protein n=1 Tax=Caenorhabditis bovis TaxID=2654633 RepID=A0A8S1ES62_9PELO|nr:unnamed protein product [Caenorhabditis bovis]